MYIYRSIPCDYNEPERVEISDSLEHIVETAYADYKKDIRYVRAYKKRFKIHTPATDNDTDLETFKQFFSKDKLTEGVTYEYYDKKTKWKAAYNILEFIPEERPAV